MAQSSRFKTSVSEAKLPRVLIGTPKFGSGSICSFKTQKKQKVTKVNQNFWFYVFCLVDKHSRRLKHIFKALTLLDEKNRKTKNEFLVFDKNQTKALVWFLYGFCLVEKHVFVFYKRFYNVFYKHHFLSIFLSSYNYLKIFVIYWITSLSQQRIQGGDWGHWGHVPVSPPHSGQVKEKNGSRSSKKVQNLKNFRLRRLSAIFSPKFCNLNLTKDSKKITNFFARAFGAQCYPRKSKF